MQGIEPLEARIAPAFSMSLGSSATVHVTSSTSGSITTFTATATGANLSWQDVESAFVAGHSVVITSGTTGTEAGNIIDQTGFQLTSLPANETLTIQSGTGTGLVGNISLGAITLTGTGESIVVHAAGSLTTGALSAGTPSAPLPLASAALTAGTSANGGPVAAVNVSIGAKTGIGTAASPFLTAASALVANNSSLATTAGGIFITNGTASNPLPLTIGFASDPFHGIQDTTANTDPITLINFGSININNHTVANEIVSAPGNVIVTANGAASDVLTGTSLNNYSNSNGALQGAIVSTLHNVTVTAGRDVLLGDSSGMNRTGNVLAGGTIALNAGRDITVNDGSAVQAARFDSANGAILASAQGNISLLNTGGNGATLRTQEAPITLTTGPGGNFTAHAGNSSSVTDVVGGPITITADTVTLADPFTLGNGTGFVRILPSTPGRQIDLGANPSPGKLGLSNADLATMGPAILYVGDLTNTGKIINTAAIVTPSGWNDLELDSAGDIVESGGSISALFLSFQASTGIGSSAPMQVAKGSFLAFNNTVSGAVQISGAAFLGVGVEHNLSASANSGGAVNLTSVGKLEFTAAVTSLGALTATANASGGAGQLITVDNGAVIQSTAGDLTFNASGNITIPSGATVSALGALNLNGNVGNPHPGTGATFNLNGLLAGSSITATGNVNNDTYTLGSNLLHSGITLNIAGGGGTDSLPLTGAGTEAVVWAPSSSASYSGSLAITSASTTTINYSESAEGNLTPVLSTYKSLALNSTAAAHYTLDTAGGGSATLFTDAAVPNVEKILFAAVPTLGVNLGLAELATDSSSLAVNSLAGESALATLAVTTGAGADSLNMNVASPALPVSGGGAFTWVGGGDADTINATTAAGSYILTNGALTYPQGGGVMVSFPQSDIENANLTDASGLTLFNINGWTGGGSLVESAPYYGSMNVREAGSYTLSNDLLTNSNGLHMSLTRIETANLTDTDPVGGNTFTLDGWTGGGSLGGLGTTPDIVAATEAGDYLLEQVNLSNSNGLSMSLSDIHTASLTETAGSHTFTVSTWLYGGTLIDTAAAADTVIAGKTGNMTLSNTHLSTADGMSLGLSHIGTALLTEYGGGNTFTLNGWTGGGSLTDAGTLADTVNAKDSASFTLTDALLTDTNGLSMALANITTANLTDTGGGNTFILSDWHGSGSLTDSSGSPDSVSATAAGNFTLSNSNLSNSSGLNMSLVFVTTAYLTDTAGGNSFTVSGWTHAGYLTDTGVDADTVIAAKNRSMTLASNMLASEDGMTFNLTHIGTANLTETGGGHSITLNGWAGLGSITDTGSMPDTLIAQQAGDFTLTDTQIKTSYGLNMTLANITTANLIDIKGGSSFDVSGWTHDGTLQDSGTDGDRVIATKDGSFTLSTTGLTSTDGMNFVLIKVGTADLTDTGGGNTFTIANWTGAASLTDLGVVGDTVSDTASGNFILNDSTLTQGVSPISLTHITTANLTDTGGNHTFVITGWTGGGSLKSLQTAGDVLIDSENLSYVLSNGFLGRTGLPTLQLQNFVDANLTASAQSNSFTVDGWTHSATLVGVGGNAIYATKDADFSLTDTSLVSTDSMSLALTGITVANLTSVAHSHTFTITGWSGSGSLTGAGGASDKVIAVDDSDFTLKDTSLTRSGQPMTLANIEFADLQAISLIDPADSHTFTVSDWSGGGTLTGAGASDKVTAVNDADFTLTNTSLARTGRPTLTLANIGLADLQATVQSHSFNVSDWTYGGILRGSSGNADSVTAVNAADFILGNSILSRTGAGSLQLAGIEIANLTDSDAGGSGHTFTVSEWTGRGALTGVAGHGDQIISNKNADAVLTNTLLYTSDHMELTLANIPNASLAAGSDTASHTLDARAFDSGDFASIGGLTLTGGGGNDTLIAGHGTNILHGGIQSDRFVLSGQSISDTLITSVMGAANAAAQLAHRAPVKVNGAEQRDLIDYGNDTSGTGVTVDLRKESQNVKTPKAPGATGNLVLHNADGSFGLFSDLIGSQYNDTLTGNALSNIIYFGGGKKTKDTLAGGGVPARGKHDFLIGNAHTHFTPPTHGSGEIDSLYRKGAPFAAVVPIHIPTPTYALIVASGDAGDPYIASATALPGAAPIPDLLVTRRM